MYNDFPESKYALTTTGIRPDLILNLAKDLKELKFKLTLSLHASNQETRNKIIPKSISLEELIKVGKQYEDLSAKKLAWNYVMLYNLNDSKDDALELIRILGKDESLKINEYNDFHISKFSKSNEENIKRFVEVLEGNIAYEYYKTNGSDVRGACGQMICKKNEEK